MAKQQTTQEDQQSTLLNLNTKELSPYWVDPDQPLLVPDNPLHWKAHKLQILVETLQVQAGKNPAQFNSKNYIDAVDAYTKCIEAIKDGKPNDDTGRMAEVSAGEAEAMGEGNASSVDSRVSTDNPTAG